MCQLGRRVEYLHLERPRAEKRQLCQTLRARELSMVMVIETETAVAWMAQQVAAAFTQHE